MRVDRDFADADLAGTDDDKVSALRAALDDSASSGMVDAREAFGRLLAKYRQRTA